MKAQGSDAAGRTVKVLRPQDRDKNRTAFYNWFMRTECARLKEVHGGDSPLQVLFHLILPLGLCRVFPWNQCHMSLQQKCVAVTQCAFVYV